MFIETNLVYVTNEVFKVVQKMPDYSHGIDGFWLLAGLALMFWGLGQIVKHVQ